jgi:polysaccharide biosynthesis protein PslG
MRSARGPAQIALAIAIAICSGVGAAPAHGSAGTPFFGVVPQAPLKAQDWSRIGREGLALRLPVRWYEVEPRRGEFDFDALDEAMTEAAKHGVRVMPQVGGSPSWVASDPAQAPLGAANLAAWSGFLRRLVHRYGPGGELWSEVPARGAAVHRWQVWNEPNFPAFWTDPSPPDYVRLLRASAFAIRGVDRHAVIVAAALAPIVGEPPPWEFLREMYRVPGAQSAFDVAALHPYTSSLAGLEFVIRMTRQVMAQAGDARTPLLISEIGVASDARIRTPFNRGLRGQARFLGRGFSRLATQRRRWRLAGAYWFAWQDAAGSDPICAFCEYAGLLDKGGDPKPAWGALKRILARFGSGPFR